MKRIFQTFWTKPMDDNKLQKNVYIAALSVQYAKASGYYVVMYTDTLGYSYLKDLGYDEINTYLDNIPEDVNPSQFFAYPKFFAGLKEEIGSIHIDFDVFLKKPCVDKFFNDKSIDIILQCEEGYARFYRDYVYGREQILNHEYPETLKVNHLDSSNVGVVGFNNQELKDLYYSWYFDYIDFYKNRLSYLQGVASEMFSEQVNIDYLMKTGKYNCFYLLPKDSGRNNEIVNKCADDIGYQHLQGSNKYRRVIIDKVLQVLGNKFPDTLKLVKKLFNEDN